MDARLQKIQITPVKFDKEGAITKEEFATLTVEIPMDSDSQREAVIELLSLLNRDFIYVDVNCPRKQKADADNVKAAVEIDSAEMTPKAAATAAVDAVKEVFKAQ